MRNDGWIQQQFAVLLDMAKHDRPQIIWIDSHQIYPSSKGFAYSERPVTPVLPLLDRGIPANFIHEPEGVGQAYRPLTLNWHIFFSAED